MTGLPALPPSGTAPARDGASPSPKKDRQRRRCGDEVPTPSLPARPAGNPSGRKRARLSARRRHQRSRDRVPSALRPSSQPPDRRTRQSKAQPLELRLLIQFCACCPPYVSERTESACFGARQSSQLVNAANGECFIICNWNLAQLQKIRGEFRFDLETVPCGENRAVLDLSATQARQQPLARK